MSFSHWRNPLTTSFYGDKWYTKPAQTYFYQKDIIAQQWIPWESHGIFYPILGDKALFLMGCQKLKAD